MTDSSRCSASIEIGGSLGFPVLERIAAAAEASGARLDWNGGRLTAGDVFAAVSDAVQARETLVLVSDNGLFGAFTEMEEILTAAALPWSRTIESDNEGADTLPGVSAFDGRLPLQGRAASRYRVPAVSLDDATKDAIAVISNPVARPGAR